MKALLLAVPVVLGLGLAVDRGAAHVADQKVAEEIAQQAGLPAAPRVDITGFPFLTQAVEGRYDDVRILLSSAALGLPEGARADVSLHGVHLPLADVARGAVQELRVDRVEGAALVPYAVLAAELGGNVTVAPEGDGGVRITRTVPVGSQAVAVTEVGSLRLDGDVLSLAVEQTTAPGTALPASTLRQLAGRLELRYRIPSLPFGLTLSGVTASAGGVRVSVAASDAVLRG